MRIIVALLIFGFIIFFHELGHFLLAKKAGIKVNEFNIGMGPAIIKFQRGETQYALRPFPFGGSCMMEGEDEESSESNAFCNKPLRQRFAVVFAGPFFNFILAFVLAVIMLSFVGVDKPIIVNTMEGYPAATAGIREGDEILSLNGHRTYFHRDINMYSFFHPGEEVTVKFKRDGETQSVDISPQYNEEDGRYYYGFISSGQRHKVGILGTIGYGFCEVRYQIYTTVKALGRLVTGGLSINDLSGPVGIVKAIGDTYETSSNDGIYYVFMNLINFTILLSANLGVMNLLPIPALDGGRILLFIVEGIRGKKLSENIEGKIHLVGFALLMLLMVVVLFNDIRKLFI